MNFFSVVWTILASIKLRFSGISCFPSYIRTKYGYDTFKLFRSLEKMEKKSEKLRLDLKFLQLCHFHEVYPKFIYFKLHKSSLYKTQFYKDSLEHLLCTEIKLKEKDSEKLSSSLSPLRANLNMKLS